MSQKLSTQPQSTTNTQSMSKPASPYKEMCAPCEKLCFRYPPGWSVKVEETDVNGMRADVVLM